MYENTPSLTVAKLRISVGPRVAILSRNFRLDNLSNSKLSPLFGLLLFYTIVPWRLGRYLNILQVLNSAFHLHSAVTPLHNIFKTSKMNIELEKEDLDSASLWERISRKLLTLGVETRGEQLLLTSLHLHLLRSLFPKGFNSFL